MNSELEVLQDVSRRLTTLGLSFMLTGSFALAWYETPRMTRDLDLVVAIAEDDVGCLTAAFSADYYLDADAARAAIRSERLFNLMHFASGIKVDLIVRKSTEYRQVEFSRRKAITFAGVPTWIVSREDLILSKLVWARESSSELQLRDVRQLLGTGLELDYLLRWASVLGVDARLRELLP